MIGRHAGVSRRTPKSLKYAASLVALVAASVFVIATLAACGGSPGTDGEPTTTTSPSGSIAHPTGSDELVMRIEVGGGFVPVEYNLTYVPEFSLYGDGRVIVSGPIPAIFPGPALPNLQQTIVPQEAVQEMLAAAKEAGLFQNGVDYGQPNITDVGGATIVVNAEGASYRTDIYALGMEEGAGGLSLEQLQARAAIQDLRIKLTDIVTFTSQELTWSPYEYTSLFVYGMAIDPANDGGLDVEPNTLAWPLTDPATWDETMPVGFLRTLVTGEELAQLRPLLREATQITRWTSGDGVYNLYFRPLLPDEKG